MSTIEELKAEIEWLKEENEQLRAQVEALQEVSDNLYYRSEETSRRHSEQLRQAERDRDNLRTDLYAEQDRAAQEKRKLRRGW